MNMKTSARIMPAFLAAGLLALAGYSLQAQPKLKAGNIDKVIKAMTLEEKIRIVVGVNHDYGSTTTVPGIAGRTAPIERLGIPATVMADGPMGLRIEPKREGDPNSYYCTAFPIGTAVAATWDTDLVYEMGQVLGREVKEHGVDVLLGPGMNLQRNPLNGRNFEYYSEDPVVTGKIASAYVRGVQSQGVGTSIKHYAANNQETQRIINDTRVSARALRELYLKGFEICVKEAQPWTVMSSYNRLNGPWTQEDKGLLTNILRDEWGFRNVVVTDWTGLRHPVVQLESGNDIFQPGTSGEYKSLLEAARSGALDMNALDIAVKRVLELVVKTPTFKGYEYSEKVSPEAAPMVRTVGAEGCVLLKNDGVLPLAVSELSRTSGKKEIALFGVGSYDTQGTGWGAGNVFSEHIVTLREGLQAAGFDLESRLVDLYSDYVKFGRKNLDYNEWIRVHVGKALVPDIPLSVKFITSLAQSSDIALLTIGRNSGECRDRLLDYDFNLTEDEKDLISKVSEAFHAKGKKVVVVLNICNPVEVASWKDKVDAILCTWLPGMEAGHSITDVLTGKVNPSGRLPMTFPNDYFDLPSAEDFPYDYHGKPSNNGSLKPDFTREQIRNEDYTLYSEDIYVGYRYFTTAAQEVCYPFGFGLSYTTFEYSDAKVTTLRGSGKEGNSYRLSVTVRNTGTLAGKEAVGLYVSAPSGNMAKPAKELKAFAKTRLLQPGESEVVNMDFTAYSLASFNEKASAWETASGEYKLQVGADCTAPRLEVELYVKKPYSWKTTRSCLPEEPIATSPRLMTIL